MMRAHTLLIITLVTAACGGRTTTAPRPPQPVAIDGLLAKLTPRQKIAQLVVPWLGGNYTALDDSAFQIATRWVDSLEVGGIIISVGSPYDIAANSTRSSGAPSCRCSSRRTSSGARRCASWGRRHSR